MTNSVLIGGKWLTGSRGVFDVVDPATLNVIAQVSDCGPEDAIAAVDAAHAALKQWSATAPRARADLLMKTRELMLRDAEELAQLISAENGKSLADARAEVNYAAEFFRWFAEEAVRPHGDFGSSRPEAPGPSSPIARSASPRWSPPGTSRPRWRPERSPPHSRPAAPSSSNPLPKPRSPHWPWPV